MLHPSVQQRLLRRLFKIRALSSHYATHEALRLARRIEDFESFFRQFVGEYPMRPGFMHIACSVGLLDTIRWLRAQDPPCPWDSLTCACVAERGHLHVLQWLRAQDPPCKWWRPLRMPQFDEITPMFTFIMEHMTIEELREWKGPVADVRTWLYAHKIQELNVRSDLLNVIGKYLGVGRQSKPVVVELGTRKCTWARTVRRLLNNKTPSPVTATLALNWKAAQQLAQNVPNQY